MSSITAGSGPKDLVGVGVGVDVGTDEAGGTGEDESVTTSTLAIGGSDHCESTL